jgi:hypothetical protein
MVSTRLIRLNIGEDLRTKAMELIGMGFSIAGLDLISIWIRNNPEIMLAGEHVIADPRTTIKGLPGSGIFQVPAHAIHMGRIFENGAIDIGVPVAKNEMSTICILAIE